MNERMNEWRLSWFPVFHIMYFSLVLLSDFCKTHNLCANLA